MFISEELIANNTKRFKMTVESSSFFEIIISNFTVIPTNLFQNESFKKISPLLHRLLSLLLFL